MRVTRVAFCPMVGVECRATLNITLPRGRAASGEDLNSENAPIENQDLRPESCNGANDPRCGAGLPDGTLSPERLKALRCPFLDTAKHGLKASEL